MISILISTFNEPEQYIQEAVESILSQTFIDYEVIIINDNPNRIDIKTLIDRFHDSRIFYHQNDDNIGLAMCMNKAASFSRGDVFVRMDADDIAEHDRLEVEYEVLKEKNCDLVFSSYTLIDSFSNAIPRKESINKDLCGKELSRIVSLNPTSIHHPTVMMRRSVFEKVGGYRNFPCAQDADLWLRMQEAGCRFYRCHQPLLRYRVNPQSVSRQKWYLQRLTWYYIFKLSMERMNSGGDSYSFENYSKYLDKNGIGDPKEETRLRKSYEFLEKAKNSHAISSLFYRFKAFALHPLLRQHYFDVRKKMKMLEL